MALFVATSIIVSCFVAYGDSRVAKSWKSEAWDLRVITKWLVLLVGLTGLNLGGFWVWTPLISWIAIAAFLLLTCWNPQQNHDAMLAVCALIVVAWVVSTRRLDTWWLFVAENVPSDESYLEAISNGLIEFGPSTNPLWHEVSGLGYHNLAYLIVGLINRFTTAAPYEILMNVAPPLFSLSVISSTLLLINRVFSSKLIALKLGWQILLGISACLLICRLRGHPSSMLGFASLVGSLVIVSSSQEINSKVREAFLVALSILVVAFSKGPLILGTLVVAMLFVLFNLRSNWRIGLAVILSTVSILGFFSAVSRAASPLEFEFWAYQTMASRFGWSFYNLKLFFSMWIVPVITGLVSALIVAVVPRMGAKRWILALTLTIAAGVLSQILVVSSDGVANEGYFYFPAVIFSGLAISFAATATASKFELARKWIFLVAGVSAISSFVTGNLATRFDSPSVNSLTLSSLVVATAGAYILMIRVLGSRRLTVSIGALSSVAMLFLSFSVIINQARTDWARFERLPSLGKNREFSNWYGLEPMADLVHFLKQNTFTDDLIASTICVPSNDQSDSCEPDFRLAALSGRRFLASDPQFSEKYASADLWSDIELSSTLDTKPPAESVRELEARGVSYLILDKTKLRPQWVQRATSLPQLSVFENQTYVVIKLGIKLDVAS